MAQASAEKLVLTKPTKYERVALAPNGEQLAKTKQPPFPKENETNPSVHILSLCDGRESALSFIDLEKAYDRIPREELWKCLRLPKTSEC